MREADHSKAWRSLRGLNITWILLGVTGPPSGMGELFSFHGLRIFASGSGSLLSSCQYVSYIFATCSSRTRCPTLECPNIPPFVIFVDPVQTCFGILFSSNTINLL